jgi:RNA ligase (TIGR02306 family)
VSTDIDTPRALATIEKILSLAPIEGADQIVAAKVRGWTVVVRIGEFSVGDMVVYFEIDTALPVSDERFAFLEPRGTKDIGGSRYHVLKTARLRGVYSQGLVLPLSIFDYDLAHFWATIEDEVVGHDVTKELRLFKWEPPLPMGGQQAGPFLTKYAAKTDSERAQNLGDVWGELRKYEWLPTEKVDGTSCTIVCDQDNEIRVCGRNWEITPGDNLYWRNARSIPWEYLFPGEVVQAEIVGPGVQGNRLGLPAERLVVFSFLRDGEHLPRDKWPRWALDLAAPIYAGPETLEASVEDMIAWVDGTWSLLSPGRLAEGVVFHTADGSVVPELGRSTFKIVSNKYLSKEK